MLTKIREKAQGAFAWFILISICVPFALWGIQNYTDSGKEIPVASVGDKDFYERDANKAYEQYRQQFQGTNIDERILKTQALKKLIRDEVLLQYVNAEGLATSDNSARDFIKTLPYFQVNGKFNDGQYKALLNSQRITSAEFVNKIKNALDMEQFQSGIISSSFATQADLENFFKIQNQQRDIEYTTLPVQTPSEQPTAEDISAYYQKHKDSYQIPEQVSVEYIELSLADLAKKVAVTDEKLKAFYEEHKDEYTRAERRKISHILFTVNAKTDDKTALAKAQKAKQELAKKDFATLASEVSEDTVTAKKGGDLGLFTAGVMEKPFEEAVNKLQPGEVSNPVKTTFGYHLIKVTELVPGEVKPFETVKDDVTKAYQKSEGEDAFYQAGETLTQMSYEHPDNLQAAASSLGLTIKKSTLFSKNKGDGIAADDKIRSAAFTDEVLQGNNSTPIESGSDRLVVVRLLEHKTATTLELNAVKQEVSAVLIKEKAKLLTSEKAKQIKSRLLAGESIQTIAAENKLEVKKLSGLTRNKTDLPAPLTEAVFKAAKPVAGKPSVFVTALPNGDQVIVSLLKVVPGVMSEQDKKNQSLAIKNIANALGQAEFNALVDSLQKSADITVNTKAQ